VFDANKLSFYAATCYTWLGDGEHAREHAAQVIGQCLEVPGQVRWPVRLAETRVDLGLVAAREGRIDEACELGRQALAAVVKVTVVAVENLTVGSAMWLPAASVAPGR